MPLSPGTRLGRYEVISPLGAGGMGEVILAGLREPRELPNWARRGASFEGLVIEELVAWASDQLVRPEICFWRTQAGAEVDLLIIHLPL